MAALWSQCFVWLSVVITRAKKWYKYILHFVTGQCEFERSLLICTSNNKVHEITAQLANSFKNSQQLSHLKLPKQMPDFDADVFVDAVVTIKRIPRNSERTITCIHQWVEREKEIHNLLAELTKRANEAYSSANQRHETSLENLWTLLKPGIKRTGRITKEWQEIGFQGTDPQTDFRSMGMLGLENMIYFASTYPNVAKSIVEKREYSYPFAIGGISITKNLLDLCRKGSFDVYFYRNGGTLEQFHELYSRATIEFMKFYESEKPPNIMHFELIMKKFVTNIHGLVH